ncbi:hypothetical protein NE237_003261 [Protea cynaroides]|uniref:Uncharacterized protein n=1 Tax=Protea cynaroides TaxID=273540 RepID=A0A9Q0KGM9_9MAGN|nr:hypothetical protein NE237_003261 [Protea cynaroides]
MHAARHPVEPAKRRDLRKDAPRIPFVLSAISTGFQKSIFMSSRSTAASIVSCKSGNKNDFFVWILVCLLPQFLGTAIAYVNFLLFKAIVRNPSSSVCILDCFGETLL